MTTLFKGRFKTDRDNPRPISVLPCISKAQEIFANLDLQEFAAENILIGDHQFAYVRNSSTIAALIITVDSWKFAIDKGEKVVCTFLDLIKAFEITDHDILIRKLLKTQVPGKELKWFTSCIYTKGSNLSSSKAWSRNEVNYTRGFAGFTQSSGRHPYNRDRRYVQG